MATPDEIIVSSFGAEAQAFQSLYAARSEKRSRHERMVKEALASLDKTFANVQQFREDKDVKSISDAISNALASGNPEAVYDVLYQTPTTTVAGTKFKEGALQRAQEALARRRESEYLTGARERQGALEKYAIDEAKFRRSLYPTKRKGALLELERERTAIEANQAATAASRASTKIALSGEERQASLFGYETRLRDYQEKIEAIDLELKNMAKDDALLQKTLLQYRGSLDPRVFGSYTDLNGRSRTDILNESLAKLPDNPEVAGILRSAVQKMADEDSKFAVAREEAVAQLSPYYIATFAPGAEKKISTAAALAISDMPDAISSGDPTKLLNFITNVRTRALGEKYSGRQIPPELQRMGIDQDTLWEMAMQESLNTWELSLRNTIKLRNLDAKRKAFSDAMSKRILPNMSDEDYQKVALQVMNELGIDPKELQQSQNPDGVSVPTRGDEDATLREIEDY